MIYHRPRHSRLERTKNTFLFIKGWPERVSLHEILVFGAVFYFSNYLWSGWFGPLVPTETPSDWSGWPLTNSHTIDHWPKGRAVSKVTQLTKRQSTQWHLHQFRGSQGYVCQIKRFLNSSAFREAEAMGTVGVCPSCIAMLLLWVKMLIEILKILWNIEYRRV